MAAFKTRQKLDPRRVRTCETYKVAYESRAEALEGCERAMANDMVLPGCHLMPYQCSRCKQWHARNVVIVQLGRHRRSVFQLNGEKHARPV